jgi:hypothetical protein
VLHLQNEALCIIVLSQNFHLDASGLSIGVEPAGPDRH